MELMNQLRLKFETRQISGAERPEYAERVFTDVVQNSRQINDKKFSRISTGDLSLLFSAIDRLAFDSQITEFCRHFDLPLTFRLGKRMTKTGGTTTRRVFPHRSHRPEFEIAVSPSLLFNTFQVDDQATVAGVVCHTPFDAMRLIMEHEMLHLVEMLLWKGSSCAGERFRGASRRLFGHQSSKHELLTGASIAKKHFDIAVGDVVSFDVAGRSVFGRVNRVTQRATVLVPDERGERYNDGFRYVKYYVPLRCLAKCS